MKPPNQSNLIVVGAGPATSLELFAAAMFATLATGAQKFVSIIPGTTLKAKRDRAYNMAVAAGCKSPGKVLDKPGTALTSAAPSGHNRDTIALGSNSTTGQCTFDDADNYARSTTEAIDGGITAFANDFIFGAATGGKDPSWRPAIGAS